MKGDVTELNHLKELLHTFAESTLLKVNFDKSMMVPINIAVDTFDELATTFGCIKGSLPFTYLGLPLSLTKPTVADFWPLVSKCERRLVAFSSYLSEAGRLELTNAVLTALPTFAMSSFLLPKTVIKQIDKYRKHCLWRGSDVSSKKPSKAAWPLVCLPKPEGGLGVLNLTVQNESLLLKHLHKFYNRAPIPWVQLVWTKYYSRDKLPVAGTTFRGSFWWRDILKLIDQFKGIAMVSVRDGKSCFLWHDLWNGTVCSQSFPELFSSAKNQNISVSVAAANSPLHAHFHLPLPPEAYAQYLQLIDMIQSIQFQHDNEVWSYIWGSSVFSSRKAYKQLIGHRHIHQSFFWLWKSSCQNKCKFFFLSYSSGKIKYKSSP
jgi:hypothetical protein